MLNKQNYRRVILFVLFLIGGLAIFLLGSNYFNHFPTNRKHLF